MPVSTKYGSSVGQFSEIAANTHSPSGRTMSTSNSGPSRYSSSKRSCPWRKIAFSSGVMSADTRA